jgi:hypothetical protein
MKALILGAIGATVAAGALMALPATAQQQPPHGPGPDGQSPWGAPGSIVNDPRFPAPDCHAYVAYDRDMVLPGYILPTKAGPRTCIPFTTVRSHAPVGYKGDFYVDNFTDEKLRQRWEDCEHNPDCRRRVYDQVVKRHPPNHEYGLTDPRGRFLLGKIDEKGADTDLSQIRRPGFFARAPYNEPIAAADRDTYVVEFTGPVEAYERLHMHMTGDVKIRGWYIRGAGVDDGHGHKKRALIIMNGGGGDRITAIDDPHDIAYSVDPKTGVTIPDDDWPKGGTGVQGERFWRQTWFRLHQAGFDVLAMDRRGVGISGGYSDTNTLQQGHDLLQIIGELRTGQGMRTLSPDGRVSTGAAAAMAARGGPTATGLPVFFMGSSRGTMASGWAMTINFDKDCSYDLPQVTCKPPVEDNTVKGAIMVADFSSGVGYLESETSPKDDGRGPGRDRGLFIGGIEEANNIVFFPSSAILHGISKWPSGFFARGLWCYADGLEGEIASYSRVHGLKELDVVRGPHAWETWPEVEKERIRDRIITYATAVIFDRPSIPGQRPWSTMKQLVATSDDVWEPSTKPTQVP